LRFGVATAALLLIMRLRGESFRIRRQDIIPVILLGFGGLAIAFVITTVSVRVLNFMPHDKPYISD
jgi:hypothetical protein